MTPQRFAKLNILLTAVIFAAFGLWFLVHPAVLEITGVSVDTASARVEIRAFYGGLELGVAGFLFLAWKRSWLVQGLVLQAAALGGIAVGRILGMLLEAERPEDLMLLLMAAELGGAVLGMIALWRIFPPPPS